MDSSKPYGPSLRVLLLGESPYFGGITSHLVALAEGLREQGGITPVLACLSGRGPDRTLFDLAAARNMDVLEVSMRGRFDVSVMNRLCALAKDQSIGLVHTHNYRATLLAAAALRHLPLVVSCHGVAGPSVPLPVRMWQALELRCMRRARAVIACSEQVRRDLPAHGIPATKLSVVRNGVPGPNPAAISPPTGALRKSLGIPGGGPVVLFAGRMVEGKGLDLLLEACAQRREWTCVAVGDGPARPELEAMARRRGLEVFFAGMQADMTPWLSAADVVALPSRSEAYPMVLLEAAAHGRPVIATDVGGVSEIVENHKSGVLVPDPAGSDTVADLTAALDLLGDAQLRAEMGQYARTRWQAEFTPAQMARSTAEIYRAALKSPF
jgi:glycosyltransferase involved in cell wall biosynthesis